MLAMACVGGALSFLVLLVTASSIDSGANWFAREVFDTETCSSTPVIVNLSKAVQCRSCQCSSFKSNNVTRYAQNICNITNAFTFANGVFGENNYIVVEDFRGSKCENLRATTILPASGSCMQTDVFGNIPIIMMLFANGSALIKMFAEKDCNSIAFKSVVLDSGTISSGRCVQNHYKFYTKASESIPDLRGESEENFNSASRDRNAIEGLGVLAILGIIVGAGIVGFLTAIFVWKWRFSRDDQSSEDDRRCVNYTSLQNRKTSTFISSSARSSYNKNGRLQRSISYYWDDDDIAAARVDRDKIELNQVISRGGDAQVMSGWFKGQHVAIKMLLPENRKNMKLLNSFLEEVKLMSNLEHPRIVRFIGVAWDSLSDLCLLTEFMEGGDLRALLMSYEAQNLPVGFNATKVTIALHLAHALTYLHSLDPPVLHRDLKSKNILLSLSLDARLSDFGVSRENVDKTMTAGVGTSRWMAPEVMMGERYNVQADVFSMGIVLSELDLHTLPYSHAMEDKDSDRNFSSAAIIHMVALGKIRAQFSSEGSMAELGLSCINVNPVDRPTAAEVLYKIHRILTTEYNRDSCDEGSL